MYSAKTLGALWALLVKGLSLYLEELPVVTRQGLLVSAPLVCLGPSSLCRDGCCQDFSGMVQHMGSVVLGAGVSQPMHVAGMEDASL